MAVPLQLAHVPLAVHPVKPVRPHQRRDFDFRLPLTNSHMVRYVLAQLTLGYACESPVTLFNGSQVCAEAPERTVLILFVLPPPTRLLPLLSRHLLTIRSGQLHFALWGDLLRFSQTCAIYQTSRVLGKSFFHH